MADGRSGAAGRREKTNQSIASSPRATSPRGTGAGGLFAARRHTEGDLPPAGRYDSAEESGEANVAGPRPHDPETGQVGHEVSAM